MYSFTLQESDRMGRKGNCIKKNKIVPAAYLEFWGKKTALETLTFSIKPIVMMTSRPGLRHCFFLLHFLCWFCIFVWSGWLWFPYHLLENSFLYCSTHRWLPWNIFILPLLSSGIRTILTSEPKPVRISPCLFCSCCFREVTQPCISTGSSFSRSIQDFFHRQLELV